MLGLTSDEVLDVDIHMQSILANESNPRGVIVPSDLTVTSSADTAPDVAPVNPSINAGYASFLRIAEAGLSQEVVRRGGRKRARFVLSQNN